MVPKHRVHHALSKELNIEHSPDDHKPIVAIETKESHWNFAVIYSGCFAGHFSVGVSASMSMTCDDL